MSLSPAAVYSPALLDATPADDHYECPQCRRHCKSRTWLLKHLESCSRANHSPSTHGIMTSGEGSAGPSTTAVPAAMPSHLQHAPRHQRHFSRGSGTEEVMPNLLESVDSSRSSSDTSFSHGRSRKPSRLRHTAVGGGRDMSAGDSIAAGGSLNAAAFSRNCAVGHSGQRDPRAESMHTTPTATSRASAYGLIDDAPAAAPNGTSRPTSPSLGSSSHVASPRGVRVALGSGGGESGPTSALIGSRRAMASPPSGTAFLPAGQPREESLSAHRPPARQGSLRLQSDCTWTQFTPSSSEDDGEQDGSFFGHLSRHSSRSLGRPRGSGSAAAAGTRDAGSMYMSGASGGGSFRQARSPARADRSPDTWLHERQYSGGSHRNGSCSPAAAAGDAVGRPSVPGAFQTASLPREGERQVPRLFASSMADFSPLDRNPSGAADGVLSVGSGRQHRSARESASPTSLSRMSSSASPMFAQAMASPGTLNISVPPIPVTSGNSLSRLSGLNASTSVTGGTRTPRHGDRSGVGTPRAISFQRGRAVGSGGFGTVYQAILSDGSLAAVKELKLENTNFKAIDREVRAMSGIPPHPNCVRYLGSRYSAHHYYIIMEYISGGSINSLRKSVGRFRESVFQRYAYMVLLGLSHLHTHGIVHRDIKGANVLLDESGCAKIVDFGCSRDLNQATTTLSGAGTPLWMAPEVCRGEPTTDKSDVWAYGCLCLEMTNDTGVPWNFPPGMTLQGVVYALACAKSSPPIPTDLSPEAQDFLKRCLQVDPGERATVAELLQHPFFDVDLMEDSDEEMLSSCGPSARQSAVKRAIQEVNGGSLDAAADARSPLERGGFLAEESNGARHSPLMQGLAAASLTPREMRSGGAGNLLDTEGGVASRSTESHSKSPSGPQLDHYTRSVNMGFSLQAVDEDDEDAAAKPGLVPSGTSVAGAPPAIRETAVPAHRRNPSASYGTVAEEALDEDEYTQMITEIITQAREAYTDEERRMTERRRRRNVMYSSSDDDTSVTATVSSGSYVSNGGGSSAEAPEGSHHGGAESDMSTMSSSDADEGGRSRDAGGPRRHSLGVTWRGQQAIATAASSGCTTPSKLGARTAESRIPAGHVTPKSQGPSAGSYARGSTPAVSPVMPGAHTDPTSASLSIYTPSPASSVTGLAAQRSPHGTLLVPALAASYPPRQQPPPTLQQQQPTAHPQPARQGHVVPSTCPRAGGRGELARDTVPGRGNITFVRSPSDGIVASPAGGGVALSPSEPRGPAGSTAPRQPTTAAVSAFPTPSTSPPTRTTNSGTPPALAAPPSTSAHRSLYNGNVLSDRSSSHTPPQTAPLAVGGPHRRTPPQATSPASASPASSVTHADFAGSPIEWYTGGSGRLEAGTASWRTGAASAQPKELSMAQREMQEMLDWGTSSDRRHTLSSSSLDATRRDAKSTAAANGRTRHHRHSRSHDEDLDSSLTTPTETTSRRDSAGISATEEVAANLHSPPAAKRKHSGLNIFRSRKSK